MCQLIFTGCWILTCLYLTAVSALSGNPRVARDGSSNSQNRRARYDYSIISRNYYYQQATYSALRQSVIGYARYSRVYSGLHKLTSKYYSQYFTFLRKPDYTMYQRRSHKEISVCRNFEANENGTYLGIYTCPLPFEPENYVYCCGESNAEYCCQFQDSSLNIIGAFFLSLFFICPAVCILYAVQSWCKKEARLQRAIRKRWRDVIERVMDREKKEEFKANLLPSLPVDQDALSDLKGSVPSLSSISSTDIHGHFNKSFSDEDEIINTIEISNGTLHDVTEISDDVIDSVTSSPDTYVYDLEESSSDNIVGDLQKTASYSSVPCKSTNTTGSLTTNIPMNVGVLSVPNVEGAVDCPRLPRVFIHVPIAWPVTDGNDTNIGQTDSSWI